MWTILLLAEGKRQLSLFMKHLSRQNNEILRNPIASLSTKRVSRVSFATDTRTSRASESRVSLAPDSHTYRTSESRPSGESRRTRAFHTGYVPPVPDLPMDDSDTGSMSPKQSQGPLMLTPNDIRIRITHNNQSSSSEHEMDGVLPALRIKSSMIFLFYFLLIHPFILVM